MEAVEAVEEEEDDQLLFAASITVNLMFRRRMKRLWRL